MRNMLKIAQFAKNSSKLPNMLKIAQFAQKSRSQVWTFPQISYYHYHFTVECIEEGTAFTKARFYGVKKNLNGKWVPVGPQLGPEDRYDRTNDFHGCQDSCRKYDKCKYWTWTKRNPGQCYGDWPCYGGCFLIAGQKTVIKDSRFVSGGMRKKCEPHP